MIPEFERDGVYVVRKLITDDDMRPWQLAYSIMAAKGRAPGWNKVEVNGPFEEPLASLYKHPAIVDLAVQAFGPDIALYNYRLVVKDKHARDAMFLHQDTPYHVGHMRKASIFVALSQCRPANGAMRFFLGSHKFGYLGDAGEIDSPVTGAAGWSLDAGDAILMHSACWHFSTPNETPTIDRVLADIIVQPADDPSGIELLAGEWRCKPRLWLRSGDLFKRSRVSRIKELEEEVRRLRTNGE